MVETLEGFGVEADWVLRASIWQRDRRARVHEWDWELLRQRGGRNLLQDDQG
jgi:hypothetical protein